MTIYAAFSVVGNVRITASVNESVRTDAYSHAERDAKHDPMRNGNSFHFLPELQLSRSLDQLFRAWNARLFWVTFDALEL